MSKRKLGILGNYVKGINSQIGKTLTSQKAKRIRKTLIMIGISLIIAGIIGIIISIYKRISFQAETEKYTCPELGEPGWFDCESNAMHSEHNKKVANMSGSFVSISLSMIIIGIGISLLHSGLAILLTGEGSKFIDNAISDIDEKVTVNSTPRDEQICNNCGGRLEYKNGKWKCPYCGD